jgi:hypothetical protein
MRATGHRPGAGDLGDVRGADLEIGTGEDQVVELGDGRNLPGRVVVLVVTRARDLPPANSLSSRRRSSSSPR